MAEHSTIEWTDATWNPITGCEVVSPGCTNCYAMRLAGTRLQNHPSRKGLTRDTKAGPVWTGEVRLNEQWLTLPLAWKRPRRIFVCAHADLFHDAVPNEWIDRVFGVMALCPQHTFQILTKRSARLRAYLDCRKRESAIGHAVMEIAPVGRDIRSATLSWTPRVGHDFGGRWPLPNVWLGVSAEDQRRADERVPDLLNTPAALRFMSAEPLLGPLDLTRICIAPKVRGSARAGIHLDALAGRYVESGLDYIGDWDIRGPCPTDRPALRLDWVIVGGESGPGARPMHPDWARSLRDQCSAAGVPFHFKQWGAWGPGAAFDADVSARRAYRGEIQTLVIPGSRTVKLAIPARFDDTLGPALTLEQYGKRAAGRLLDGVEHNGMPEVANALR